MPMANNNDSYGSIATQQQTEMCVCVYGFGGAGLTSTSYVYSRLVGNCPGRIVAGAAVDPSVRHVSVADVQVADDVALGVGEVGDAVAAVAGHRLVVQQPHDARLRRALHGARQRHKLVDVEDLLAEGGEDLGSAVCGEGEQERHPMRGWYCETVTSQCQYRRWSVISAWRHGCGQFLQRNNSRAAIQTPDTLACTMEPLWAQTRPRSCRMIL